MLISGIEPLAAIYDIKNEGSELMAYICRKMAYTMEILCWQNIRDVIADEIIPRTDDHIEKLLATAKTIPGMNMPMSYDNHMTPPETNTLDQERAMCMFTHTHETVTECSAENEPAPANQTRSQFASQRPTWTNTCHWKYEKATRNLDM